MKKLLLVTIISSMSLNAAQREEKEAAAGRQTSPVVYLQHTEKTPQAITFENRTQYPLRITLARRVGRDVTALRKTFTLPAPSPKAAARQTIALSDIPAEKREAERRINMAKALKAILTETLKENLTPAHATETIRTAKTASLATPRPVSPTRPLELSIGEATHFTATMLDMFGKPLGSPKEGQVRPYTVIKHNRNNIATLFFSGPAYGTGLARSV